MQKKIHYMVEDDFLSDDWCCFTTRTEAEAFVRECCVEIAENAVDESGLGTCPAWRGLTRQQIVEKLFAEHKDYIEERIL